ncbi:hypothetical protein EV421DRAFT_2034543 [Armillaria borealis]|uniref:Protein kinase domain-containing protein n=1 Tax=Armillaria borealis TaxID=47425 RepID=A0AA39JMK3_9AGAR|nr:hypothetical protein EV421DRAFT_2034543 [Armillaria borealis]
MRQLVSVSETFSDSTPRFLFSKVVYQENGDFFIARAAERSFPPAFDLESLQGKRIPLETQHLPLPPDLTDSIRAPDPLPEDTFVKTINFLSYDPDKPGAEPLGEILIQKLRVYEDLRRHPHPNICEYQGYVVDESGRVSGLCLKKYQCNLSVAIWKKMDIDFDVLMKDYKNAVDHLHNLGWIHNDISGGNLMIDANLRGVLVDFGACTREGAPIHIGTPLWAKADIWHIAEKENDYYGLQHAELFIRDGGQGPNWQLD